RVSFTVDAFPGSNFGGTISQIRLNPQNVQNVVTYNVVIDVRNPDLKLKPGMTSNLTMTIAERQDALKIPNAAMRFRPPGMTPEKVRELFRGASDTQAGGPAGKGAGGDTGKDVAKDAGAKDTGKGTIQNTGRGAGRETGTNERRGNQADGQQREADGARRAWRGRGGESGSDGAGSGGQRRDRAGRGGASGADGASNRPAPSTTPIQEGQMRIVWVLGPDNKPQPRRVKLGITDGTATEVIEGDLKEGEMIIVGQNVSADERPQQQRPPGFGGAPGGGGRGPGGFGGGGRR
ncbi:MAG: hypothetical protein ACREAM_17645, partial [Blastocatellia bacterium]